MSWQWNILAVPQLISGIIASGLLLNTLFFRNIKGANKVIALFALTAIWNIGYSIELISTNHRIIETLRTIQFSSSVFITVAFFTYIVNFTGFSNTIKNSTLAWLFLIPVVTVVLAVTNNYHHIIWISKSFVEYQGFVYLVPELGYGIWVFLIYVIILTLLTIFFLVRTIFYAPSIYMRHNLVLIFAAIFPVFVTLLDVLDVFNLSQYHLDSVSVALSAIFVRLSLTGFSGKDITKASKGLIFDSLKEAVFVIDRDGRIIDMNHKAQRVIDKNISSIMGIQLLEVIPELSGMDFFDDIHENALPMVEKDGKTYEVRISPISDSQSRVFGAAISLSDVSTILRQAADLKKSEEDYRGLFENAHDAIIIFRPKFEVIIDINQRACELYGYTWDEFIGKSLAFISKNVSVDRKKFRKVLQLGTSQTFETSQYRKDGSQIELEVNVSLVNYQGKSAILSINRDITRRKKYEEKLIYDALHDALTGLPNRALLTDRLNHAIALKKRDRQKNFAVLFLDLDNFKSVNDALGHSKGDVLLMIIAERISKSSREVDTVARFGGDEFVVFLESLNEIGDAIIVLNRVIENIHKPIVIDGHEIHITASIGVVTGENENSTAESLMRDADIALYRAKEAGGDCYRFFSISMREKFQHQITIEKKLREAINSKLLHVHYQPIISIRNSKLVGLEVLARWTNKQGTNIPPSDFIPVAEKSGLIIPLGALVFEKVGADFSIWKEKYAETKKLRVFVNVSSKQLLQGDFLELIRALEVPFENLGLEITENEIIDQFEKATKVLNKLRQYGVAIYLDDFGTGYSSLSYLNRLPIDAIKIAQYFTHQIGEPNTGRLVRTMISMTRDLDLGVVAEGIETQAQLEFLRDNQCRLGQGFYLHRPMSADQVSALLDEISPPEDDCS